MAFGGSSKGAKQRPKSGASDGKSKQMNGHDFDIWKKQDDEVSDVSLFDPCLLHFKVQIAFHSAKYYLKLVCVKRFTLSNLWSQISNLLSQIQ